MVNLAFEPRSFGGRHPERGSLFGSARSATLPIIIPRTRPPQQLVLSDTSTPEAVGRSVADMPHERSIEELQQLGQSLYRKKKFTKALDFFNQVPSSPRYLLIRFAAKYSLGARESSQSLGIVAGQSCCCLREARESEGSISGRPTDHQTAPEGCHGLPPCQQDLANARKACKSLRDL